MKKNTMMRIAAGLFVAVLLTTCAISGTFAKYVTSETVQDSARVAYWGFGASGLEITDLFKKAYDSTVSSSVDVIAPGTTGSDTFAFYYNAGTEADKPEVSYEFKVDVSESTIADDIKNNANIQWKLDSGEWGTWDQLMTAIKGLSGDNSGTKTYAAGTLPTAFADASTTHTISWQWKFSTDDAGDVKDTAMGNKATLDTVVIKIIITATQVD